MSPPHGSAVDASHHKLPGTKTYLLPRSKENLLPTTFFSFFFAFNHKEKRKKRTNNRERTHPHRAVTAEAPRQSRGKRPRCPTSPSRRGMTPAAPTTSSPDSVKRKGFSLASSSPSSETSWRHQPHHHGAAEESSHDHRQRHHHDARGAQSHKGRGRPCHQGTAYPPLLTTHATRATGGTAVDVVVARAATEEATTASHNCHPGSPEPQAEATRGRIRPRGRGSSHPKGGIGRAGRRQVTTAADGAPPSHALKGPLAPP
jgi:hypothetical protein